ncbi:hypothetical protein D3C87_1063840 [compost metagenome]
MFAHIGLAPLVFGLGIGFDQRLVQRHHQRRGGHEGRKLTLDLHDERRIIRRADVFGLQHADDEVRRTLVDAEQALHRPDEIGSLHRRAILELRIVAQMEGIGQAVFRNIPGLCQMRHDFALGVHRGQAVIHVHDGHVAGIVSHFRRVERAEYLHGVDRDRNLVIRKSSGRNKRQRDCRAERKHGKAGRKSWHFHCRSPLYCGSFAPLMVRQPCRPGRAAVRKECPGNRKPPVQRLRARGRCAADRGRGSRPRPRAGRNAGLRW